MLKVKFKKIKNNHNKLRDDEIIGKCVHIPEVGYCFDMFGEARDLKPADIPEGSIGMRQVNTNMVKTCVYDESRRTFVLGTRSGSVYEVEVLDDKDPFEYRRAVKGDFH